MAASFSLRRVGDTNGNQVIVKHYPQDGNNTAATKFFKGDVVWFDTAAACLKKIHTSTQAVFAIASGTAGADAGRWLGIAMADSDATTGLKPVELFTPTGIYEISNDPSMTKFTAPAMLNGGLAVKYTYSTTSVSTISLTATTTTPAVEVVEMAPEAVTATADQPVRCRILAARVQGWAGNY